MNPTGKNHEGTQLEQFVMRSLTWWMKSGLSSKNDLPGGTVSLEVVRQKIRELNLGDQKLEDDMTFEIVNRIVVSNMMDKKRAKKQENKEFTPVSDGIQLTPANVVEQNYSDHGAVLVTQKEKIRLKRLLAENARRKMEALKLYEPIPIQQAFHQSKARHRLVRGGNRSGKTTVAAVELARAVCGEDPFTKYPVSNGRAFCVGRNLDHIGNVMWRKLGRPGAFRIIRDKFTKQWRAYRPWDAEDAKNFHLSRPSPPLIPRRLIKRIAWENKAKNIPKMVTLTNGWELNFYSSEGKPPQGSDIDIFWLDEEIIDPDWHPELSARILDRKGCGFWSATPQAGTEKLLELHERALTEIEKFPDSPNDRSVDEFVIVLDDNPHIGEREKREFASGMSEEERKVRINGEFAINSLRVFPEFSKTMHCVQFFHVPHEWTKYAIVDPGRQVCCVLFAAVPPNHLGDSIYIYDELYIHNCDAEQFGQKMASKAVGQSFEKFIIDMHGGRLSDIGSGMNVEQQYSRALRRNRVFSQATGSGFQWGSDDVSGAIEAARGLLLVRHDGSVRLKVFDRCVNFMWEIERYRYKKDPKGFITDKPEERGRVHAMACLRYLAAANLKYKTPVAAPQVDDVVMRAFKKKQKRMKDKSAGSINLGPGKERI